MDDELRQTLEYRGSEERDLERALARHVKEGRLFDAALAARALGRLEQAAAFFERARHFAEAAACWQEAGDYRRCLQTASRVPRDHGLYRSCARLAIEAASALGELAPELPVFIAPWLSGGLRDTIDGLSVLELGDLYARLGKKQQAREAYMRLLDATGDEVARERLEALDQPTAPPPPARTAASRSRSASGSFGGPTQSDAPGIHGPMVIGPGTLIAGRYRLESPLGEGASAQVFRAADLVLDEHVAIKVFNGPFDPARRARFKREIHLARKLAHENIVRIYELVAAEGIYGLTMEIVDGLPLDRYVDETHASLATRRDLLIELANGLSYAHEHNVVHRDIKPDNVLVTHEGHVKIMDFGIAKAYEQATITMSGALGGTPYYIAPEQITNFKEVDHRADLYAVGVVAFQLFTGELPFAAETLLEVLHKHASEVPPSVRSKNPSLPEELALLIAALLEKKPEARPQSARELAQRLSVIRL